MGIPQTGNRFNALLSGWTDKPNGKFRKELKGITKKKGSRGETLLSSPQLRVRAGEDTFHIRFPVENLRGWTDGETPVWHVTADGEEILTKEPDLCRGNVCVYTDECEAHLPEEFLFRRIWMRLVASGKEYARYSICASGVRFFNDKGNRMDRSDGHIAAGSCVAFSDRPEMPEILYKENQETTKVRGVYSRRYETERGDIILLPDGHGVSVGERIEEGLTGVSPEDGVVAVVRGKDANGAGTEARIAVYSRLPRVLFKAGRDDAGGTLVSINDGEKRHRLSDTPYREFRIDEAAEDIYGYLIDLDDLIGEEGHYRIHIGVPGSKAVRDYEFVYIPGLSFGFEDAPYVFRDVGRISFPPGSGVETDEDWETTEDGGKVLCFNFDPTNKDKVSEKVADRDLVLDYGLRDGAVKLSVRIPALFWRYDEKGDWNTREPADLFLKRLPGSLFVSGPFDFDRSMTRMNVDRDPDAKRFYRESDMYAEKVRERDCYRFDLSAVKSCEDDSVPDLYLYVTLDGVTYGYAKVICRSVVENVSLSCDPGGRTIHGSVKIRGDETYTVSVSLDGEPLEDDVEIRDGRFVLETDRDGLGGTYTLVFYELWDDGGFFGAEMVQIGRFEIRLTDTRNMSGKTLKVKRVEFRDGSYSPLQLSEDYSIRVMDRVGDEELTVLEEEKIIVRWLDDSEYGHAAYYTGTLSHDGVDDFPVMVIFRNPEDAGEVTILRESGEGYVEMLYYHRTHTFMRDDDDLGRWEKKMVRTLDDDEYDIVTETEEGED